MKKIKILLIGILLLLTIPNVKAANYELKELIPINIETTIVTNHFSYRDFYYNGKGLIIFKSIKNISNKDLPITIRIGLFDENKKNLGMINYCTDKERLSAKEEKSYMITITKEHLSKEKAIDDIHYISVLDENINCRKTGSDDYVGQKVEDIGKIRDNSITSDTRLFIKIIEVLLSVIGVIFLYRFMFSKSFVNMDGEEIRKDYNKYNKKLAKEREEDKKKNPPKPKEVVSPKTKEVLQQEEEAKNKESTDLEDFYK